jgi:hypothetical protein
MIKKRKSTSRKKKKYILAKKRKSTRAVLGLVASSKEAVSRKVTRLAQAGKKKK